MTHTKTCTLCNSEVNVKEFVYLQREKSDTDSEPLCWDCRWPYIKERTHGTQADERPDGQQSLLNY